MICDKTPYGSYKEAQAATAHIKSKNGMKTYKCDNCDKFHIATIKTSKLSFKLKDKYALDYSQIKPIKKKVGSASNKSHPAKNQKSIETTYKPFAYLKSK